MEGLPIVVLDIETSPDISYVFGKKWEPTVVDYKEYSYILGFSALWLDGEHTTKTLLDYKDFKKDIHNDKSITKELWNILNKAEMVIGFNSDRFDIKKINTRFAKWGLPPPQPYRSIDLIKTVRSRFDLPSNSLDFVLKYFGIGMKLENEQGLFVKCVQGDKEAFEKLAPYNEHDTLETKLLYDKLLPWINNHPNVDTYSSSTVCPKCGSNNLQKRGFRYTNTSKYRSIWCKNCKGWSQSPLNQLEKRPLKSI